MWIIVYGNPIDGLQFVGPFEDIEVAEKFAEMDAGIKDDDWWTASLAKPEES